MSLTVQFQTLASMVISGIVLGFCFDGYRVVSGKLHFPRWIIPLLDVAYWLLAAIFIFRILFYANQGQLRLYVFLGLGIGAICYYLLFSRWVILATAALVDLIKALIRQMIHIFKLVVIAPILWMGKLIWFFLGFLAAIAVFILKFVLQLLYPVRYLVRLAWQLLLKITWLKRTVQGVHGVILRLKRYFK